MSEISGILNKLEGTRAAEVLLTIEKSYARIADEQSAWYEKSQFVCPDGCGACCVGFEPDILDGEALYMAAWLLEHQHENALRIADGLFPFDNRKTCPLFNPHSPYHCSAYGGRAFICRLFGACGTKDKNGKIVWRSCKFYPEKQCTDAQKPLLKPHITYSEVELNNTVGILPPAMSDLTEEFSAFSAENEKTELLRNSIPEAVKKILWLCEMNGNNTPAPSAA